MNHPDTPAAIPALSLHKDFIDTQLPYWLSEGSLESRQQLRRLLIAGNQARHMLKALMDELKSPETYARPLIREVIDTQFSLFLKDETSLLVREWKNSHLLGLIKNHTRTTEQSLLEAALQNFESSEAEKDGMEPGSGLYNVTESGRTLSLLAPTDFATACRELDIGGKYLKHLTDVLEPAPLPGSTRTAATVLGLFSENDRQAFGVALTISYMKGHINARLYAQLQSLQQTGSHVELPCSHLTLGGVVLPNVLMIHARRHINEYLLYVPEDPIAPFFAYRSLHEIEQTLVSRLSDPEYLAFFNRLVPLQHQGTLLALKPGGIEWVDKGQLIGQRIVSSYARLKEPMTLTPTQGDVFQAMARRRIAQIKSDARVLAVSTADIDIVSRQKRLQRWKDLGQSLLFFAASFIPIVGEVLLAVTAGQLIHSVYNGFAAWSRGDSDEALNDLLDVVDTVAQAVVTAGAIKATGFTAGLVKVHLRNKGYRLWNPDLAPYLHPTTLPQGLAADSQGIYRHKQQQFLNIDDGIHAVQRTAKGDQWELPHPTDPQAYKPPLLSNGVGGWRHAHESSRDWDDLKLIKRLGPDAANIKQPMVEPILLIGGVDTAALRQVHQDVLRPAPKLRDTVKHFNLQQELKEFDLNRAEGASVTPHSPFIQLYLVCSLRDWPTNRTLKIVDEQQNVLISQGTGPIEIRIPEARFRKGELLHALEQQLSQAEFNRLMPNLYLTYLTKVENLARNLHATAQTRHQTLFTWLKSINDKTNDPIQTDIHALVPELSKSHLEEMAAVLGPQERTRLQREKSLSSLQRWEAEQYASDARNRAVYEGVYLDSMNNSDSVPLILHSLEQLPGWPPLRQIEVNKSNGQLLYRIGDKSAATHHILVTERDMYATYDGVTKKRLHESTTLFDAIGQTLSNTERDNLLQQSGAKDLREAVRKACSRSQAQEAPLRAAINREQAVAGEGQPFDPLFAAPTPPEGLTLRADGTYQSLAQPDGSYRYYVQEQGAYFQIKPDGSDWRLIDARSRFRAYQPYVRRKTGGGWEIDPVNGALLGGLKDLPSSPDDSMDTSSSDFITAESSASEYESATEGTVELRYSANELAYMRSMRGYQYSQNYRRIYDRANNGRYPLRDEQGLPMRIRHIQSHSKSLITGEVRKSDVLRPYIRWEGFEDVARLYEDKLELVTFTAAHQKFAPEAAMIGEAAVVSRRAISKGEPLGVYGGEVLPYEIARRRRDPYLMQIRDIRPTSPYALNMQPVLSGDNILSRINTIFEYENGQPVRQAATGYNTEAAQFRVMTQVGEKPQEQAILTALFATQDIPAATELRWNYQYDEATIRAIFQR
ncbi:dermonecrotic toxin domain-containing protein [Pseudomonas lactucae]|nr:DUF6543 domain-containing protein [Pseudomonas lactucae]MBN2987950.1 hypothetical protein [Pseudomonas lactucae]